MRNIRSTLLGGLAVAALMLAGCNDANTETETRADTATETPSEAQPPQAVLDDKTAKDALLAEYATMVDKAKATNGDGSPAMWTLADEDTTIYLFGTVHLLRPELEWRTPAFETAFASADKIVFEVDMKSEEAQSKIMTDFIGRGMYQDGRTLREALPDNKEPAISAALDSVGLPLDAVNVMEPWMVFANMGVMKLTNEGYDTNSGVEMVLEAEGATAGKSFGFLETISRQADAFDLLPEDVQVEMLYESALTLDESPQMLDLLVDEWADGDIAGIEALVANPDGAGMGKVAYDALLTKRNQDWVPQIEAMLDEPGTVFIAVGAGHLAGPDSVIKMLRDNGLEVTGP